MNLGYSKNEIIKMTCDLPTIFGLSIQNIKQKIDFYESIDLKEVPGLRSKCLMQSVELTYARYMFFKEKGIQIDKNKYELLFMNGKYFEKTYKTTKAQLLEKYNFNSYLEKDKTKKLEALS